VGINSYTTSWDLTNRDMFTAATAEVNAIARQSGAALHLSPIDLEYAALSACDNEAASTLAGAIRAPVSTREELVTWLRRRKSLHLRSALASAMEWALVSSDTRVVLQRWIEAVMSRQAAQSIVKAGG
jgi:hypothetical protein